ncbi:MAG TPA: cell division protein FtsL [Anaerovoracaceae bacterium]|nr:cell division protein FtsL [Anaerovoracaceae bacterium]
MMAAEKWYEYQDSYKRYGFDMKPRTEKKDNIKSKSSNTGINAKDKFRLVMLTIFAGILCAALILSTAYAASVKYNINSLIKENTVIQGEIENLNVKIESASNIQIIEARATAELGMMYPTAEQLVFIDENKETVKDFALVLKEQAYN